MKPVYLLLSLIVLISCSKEDIPINPKGLATVTTDEVTNITETSATCSGTVTSEGGEIVTSRGICYNTEPNPTYQNYYLNQGGGIGHFSIRISGLASNTKYYIRAFAVDSTGISYGSEKSFITSDPFANTVMDYDGNVYHMITIGTQKWLVENLRVTHYRDGTPITMLADATLWGNTSSGVFAWYNNDISNKLVYGALYNWYAVNDVHGLAPVGWHVASDMEWSVLINNLGGDATAGGPLKETGVNHWSSPNTGATNTSGFTALPGGYRYNGADNNIGLGADFWTSTDGGGDYAWSRYIEYSSATVYHGLNNTPVDMHGGKAVRCIHD